MRILHIDTGREMRGGQWQVFYLISGLVARGEKCVLLARRGSPLARRVAESGALVEEVSLAAVRRHGTGCDLAHAHTGRAHTLAAAAGVSPLVVSRRVAFPVKHGWASRWKYGRATRYLAVSRYVKQTLLDADVSSERISVVNDGVPLLEPVGAGEDVVTPASDDPLKGSALARESARLAGVELRYAPDLRAGLERAALLLYLTEQEGLGSGALLAMSAAVPVVASRVGGLPEVIEDEVTGLLVENRAETVAAAIGDLMRDPERRRQMGARGRERVMKMFTLDHMVEATLAVYAEVVS